MVSPEGGAEESGTPPPTFWFQEIRDGGLPSGHSYPQEHFSPFHLFNSMGRYKMREHTFFMKNHKNQKNKSENLLWNFWKASKNFKKLQKLFFHEKNVSPHVLSSQIVVFTKNEKVLLRVKDTPKSYKLSKKR